MTGCQNTTTDSIPSANTTSRTDHTDNGDRKIDCIREEILRSGPSMSSMRLITPALPSKGLKRKGINQRNIASRPYWTQPQTCEPRHFLTPNTGRNNYLVSDTVRAQLGHPLFETKPAIRSSSHGCSHCVVSAGEQKQEKKDSRPAPQKSPEIQSCSSQTDHGSRPRPGLLSWAACIRPASDSTAVDGLERTESPGGPWARVTASATLKGDRHGHAGGPALGPTFFFSPRARGCSSSTRFDEQFQPVQLNTGDYLRFLDRSWLS